AEAVDRRARDRDGQARPDQRHPRDVATLRPVRLGAAEGQGLDLLCVALAGQGNVERPARDLGERGAEAGDDDSLSHGGSFLGGGRLLASIPQRWTVGTHAVVRPPTVSWRMCSPRTVVAGGPPRRWPQRRWKSHQRGYRSLSESDRTARPITERIFARSRRASAADRVAALRFGAMPARSRTS